MTTIQSTPVTQVRKGDKIVTGMRAGKPTARTVKSVGHGLATYSTDNQRVANPGSCSDMCVHIDHECYDVRFTGQVDLLR